MRNSSLCSLADITTNILAQSKVIILRTVRRQYARLQAYATLSTLQAYATQLHTAVNLLA